MLSSAGRTAGSRRAGRLLFNFNSVRREVCTGAARGLGSRSPSLCSRATMWQTRCAARTVATRVCILIEEMMRR